MNTFIKPLTLVMALTIPALASATIGSDQLSEDQVRITYNAYDVKTDNGRVELERQIRRAAEKVCGAQRLMDTRSMIELRANRSCFNKAVEGTLAQVNLGS